MSFFHDLGFFKPDDEVLDRPVFADSQANIGDGFVETQARICVRAFIQEFFDPPIGEIAEHAVDG